MSWVSVASKNVAQKGIVNDQSRIINYDLENQKQEPLLKQESEIEPKSTKSLTITERKSHQKQWKHKNCHSDNCCANKKKEPLATKLSNRPDPGTGHECCQLLLNEQVDQHNHNQHLNAFNKEHKKTPRDKENSKFAMATTKVDPEIFKNKSGRSKQRVSNINLNIKYYSCGPTDNLMQWIKEAEHALKSYWAIRHLWAYIVLKYVIGKARSLLQSSGALDTPNLDWEEMKDVLLAEYDKDALILYRFNKLISMQDNPMNPHTYSKKFEYFRRCAAILPESEFGIRIIFRIFWASLPFDMQTSIRRLGVPKSRQELYSFHFEKTKQMFEQLEQQSSKPIGKSKSGARTGKSLIPCSTYCEHCGIIGHLRAECKYR
ncbi:uncharacterized protein V1516DRAFT_681787 [Lipomyces oligophaga]|uniref:uncharacterized protein n=1 Tax=Lipomyces oligophaga TaxID=45792 RepID=UPI0034CF960A